MVFTFFPTAYKITSQGHGFASAVSEKKQIHTTHYLHFQVNGLCTPILSEKALSDEDEPHNLPLPKSSVKKPAKSFVNTFEPEDESFYEIVPMSMNKY